MQSESDTTSLLSCLPLALFWLLSEFVILRARLTLAADHQEVALQFVSAQVNIKLTSAWTEHVELQPDAFFLLEVFG